MFHLHFQDWEQKPAPCGYAEYTAHAHKVCLTEQSILFYALSLKKGITEHCNRVCLWPASSALHNKDQFFLLLCIVHQSVSTRGLERLIYDVNRAVKGKANRKEHAQHQRKTLSCSYIFLFTTPCICPVTTVEPPCCVQRHGAITIHHSRHAERILHKLSGCKQALTAANIVFFLNIMPFYSHSKMIISK